MVRWTRKRVGWQQVGGGRQPRLPRPPSSPPRPAHWPAHRPRRTCPLSARFISSSASLGRLVSRPGLSPTSAQHSTVWIARGGSEVGGESSKRVGLEVEACRQHSGAGQQRQQAAGRLDSSSSSGRGVRGAGARTVGAPGRGLGVAAHKQVAAHEEALGAAGGVGWGGVAGGVAGEGMEGMARPVPVRPQPPCLPFKVVASRPSTLPHPARRSAPACPWCASSARCGRCRRSAPASPRWARTKSASPAMLMWVVGGGWGQMARRVRRGTIGFAGLRGIAGCGRHAAAERCMPAAGHEGRAAARLEGADHAHGQSLGAGQLQRLVHGVKGLGGVGRGGMVERLGREVDARATMGRGTAQRSAAPRRAAGVACSTQPSAAHPHPPGRTTAPCWCACCPTGRGRQSRCRGTTRPRRGRPRTCKNQAGGVSGGQGWWWVGWGG